MRIRLWKYVACIVLWQAIAAAVVLAQPSPDPVRDPLNRQLPGWLTLGTHDRVRFESRRGIDFDSGRNDGHMESRLRLQVGVQPNNRFRLFVEAQDSRVAWLGSGRREATNPFDLRQAKIVIGDEKAGWWDVSAGRQELAFGTERLIGINQWSNVSRSFDAVKMALHRGENRVDIFSASVAVVDPDGFDHHRDGDNIHGVYGSLGRFLPGMLFEPHIIYHTRPRAVSERGLRGHAGAYTAGIRLASNTDHPWDFQTEMDWQWGTLGENDLRAFMGLWGVGYKPSLPFQPRFLVEYTYGSGDDDPGDGKIGTFDQLYVRAHRIWGIADLIGARNSKMLLTGAHFQPAPDTVLRLDHHFFWLASRNDALYRHSGPLYVAAPSGGATSAYVGHELDFQIDHNLSEYFSLGAGAAYFVPGGFLKQTTPGGSQIFSYVFLEFQL